MKRMPPVLCALALLVAGVAGAAQQPFPVQQDWLSVPPGEFNLERQEPGGVDMGYLAPDAFTRLGDYDAIMVDQPEIWLAEDSPYKGAKPDQLKALADFVRHRLTGHLLRGGYDVVETPGPGVLYLRLALTDAHLGRSRTASAGYTPVEPPAGNAAVAAVDLLAVAIQAELTDSRSGEVLVALIVQRGAPRRDARLGHVALGALVDEYGARLLCRLDNGSRPPAEWIECSNPAARNRQTSVGPGRAPGGRAAAADRRVALARGLRGSQSGPAPAAWLGAASPGLAGPQPPPRAL